MRRAFLLLMAICFTLVAVMAIGALVLAFGLVLNFWMEETWRDKAGVARAWQWWFGFAVYPIVAAVISGAIAMACWRLRRRCERAA